MSTVEYVCVFVRVGEDRLRAVERLVLALPQLLGPALARCELAFRADNRFMGVAVHLEAAALSQARRDRLSFWTARAGGRAIATAALSPPDLAQLRSHLAGCTVVRGDLAPVALAAGAAAFFTEAGAPPARKPPAGAPVLALEVAGPGWEGFRYEPETGVLFVPAPVAPPQGDAIPLAMRIPRVPQPFGLRGTVVSVTPASAEGPGHAAGFALRLEEAPQAVLAALEAHHAADGAGSELRATSRYAMKAPVKVLTPPPPPPPAAAPPPPAHATIEYASDQELAADYVENLSHGGAFVRTSHPAPVGAAVALALKLPNGTDLAARAEVAFVDANGMGVRFQLDEEAEAALSAAIAHISARPRRALVVDDDALVRAMLADALAARGFEVLTASGAQDGLRTMTDELLALDLLLTDVCMPGVNGEELVRTIRKAGGETDLAIVAVSARLEPGMEPRLEAAGADAVLDKALGPELVAQAADAVLERRRMVGDGG
jgi:uncharacterized protein (TIGR02266 family)